MVNTLRFEDRLEGALNFMSRKERILNWLEENDLDNYVTRVVAELTDDDGKVSYKKNQDKAKRILYDLVKDHLIPIISPLNTAKECYDALTSVFETKNPSRKRALKNKLCEIKMARNDTIATFFMKSFQLKDQFVAIGETMDDDDLVHTALDGRPSTWETFVSGVDAHENQPTFERLLTDCL
jgi:hypothetical protein